MSDTPPPVPPAQPAAPTPPVPAQPVSSPSPYGQPAYGQPAYGQPVYGQQPYGQPAPYAAAAPTNTLSIVALILGLSGIIFFITGVGGIICGHIAISQIKRTGENGRGMALAGLIVGYVTVGIGVLLIIGYIIFFVIFFGAFAAAGVSGSNY